MSRSCLLATITSGLVVAGSIALAQPTAPEGGDTRFTFHRADEGYLRLDGRTGQVSMCDRPTSGWQCRLVPDERAALEREITRLQDDNAALKKELLNRSLPLPGDLHQNSPAPQASAPEASPPKSSPAPKSNGQRPQFPDDEEINRVMVAIEKVWRRMVEMILSMQRDLQKRM
jgi:hypothetical protein